ncbi:MAG: long-chain-fatty-acid--CoA ligase [Acidobacteriota bacterium]|nr:long-chain-fatty-acid--CoA ligase [Acidobacteriota bacterium]
MILPLTPVRFKQHALALFGRKTGVVCGGERFTYQQFNDRCDRLSAAITGLGVNPGDRVAFLSLNCHRLLEAYYGVPQIKAILLPLNVRLSAEELAFITKDASATILFFDPELAATAREIRSAAPSIKEAICLKGAPPDWAFSQAYDDLLAANEPEPPDWTDIDENSVAEIFYTSGTTAHPKGVCLTHRNLYLHALHVAAAQRTWEDDVCTYSVPLYHVNSWGAPHTLTMMGARHVILRRFDPAALLGLIQKERITRLQMVPAMAIALINHPAFAAGDVCSVKEVMLGGAPANTALIRELEGKFPGAVVAGGYGLTETSPVVSIAYLKDHLKNEPEETNLRRKASAGRVIAGVEARLAGSGSDSQTPSELLVRGDAVMQGYWRQPEETTRALEGGWLHTGDLAAIDEEGYILIVDRLKDMVLSGGENVATAEVERVIYQHPAVLECAVIAVPDDKWGEVAKALVTLRAGASASEDDILSHCRNHLAGFKVPKSAEVRESLPKGGTGKILKRLLREPYWAGRDRQVH